MIIKVLKLNLFFNIKIKLNIIFSPSSIYNGNMQKASKKSLPKFNFLTLFVHINNNRKLNLHNTRLLFNIKIKPNIIFSPPSIYNLNVQKT